jgi:hypothetical protein
MHSGLMERIMRTALSILAAFGFVFETVRAEVYWDLITPLCVIGFENIPMLEKCESSYPEMKAELRKAHEAWKKRNAGSLKKISALCEVRLAQVFEDYDIKAEERGELIKGARQFFEKLIDERGSNKPDLASECRDQIRDINSDKWSLFQENVERDFAEIPADVLFMRTKDSSFRKDAPAGNEASYHRDRKWDFAEVVSNFKALKIGKISALSSCRHLSPEKCISNLGRPPDERRVTPSGEEHLIYYGKKLLHRGTPKNNRVVGPEWRIIVVKNGKIADEYEVVQLLERKEHFREAYYSCEEYGGRNTLLCPIVELIE